MTLSKIELGMTVAEIRRANPALSQREVLEELERRMRSSAKLNGHLKPQIRKNYKSGHHR